jgi:serine protease
VSRVSISRVSSPLLLAAGLLAALATLANPLGAQAPVVGPNYVPGEVLVTYRQAATGLHALAVNRRLGAAVVQRFAQPGLQRLRLGSGLSVEAALRSLSSDPAVASAQPNFIYHATALPNDPRYTSGDLWAMNNTGQNAGTADADIDAPEAWDLTTGSASVVVATIDTGVDYNHEDLAGNIWTNPGETGLDAQGRDKANNGIDDDGDGYVDDVHGWNAVASNGNPMDDNNHGTHVAGTIGGRENNGIGVAGVNWNVTIVATKFLDSTGSGTTASAIACLDYIHALKDHGLNVVATNNSWGGGGADAALQAAIGRSESRGILFVAAAGNGDSFGRAINNDSSPQYPASYSNANIISVTATDRNDRKASWANYGATTVDLGAPGVSIWSSVRGNAYDVYDGTSMATPHVTGAVALLKAYDPSLTYLQIKDRLLGTGDPVSDLEGKTLTGRRLNLYNALTGTVPPKPVARTMKVSVTTDKLAYTMGQTVNITVKTTDSATGAALSGATANVRVQTPAGYVQTGSAVTGASGSVTFRYQPRTSYGRGTYSATATAAKFTVK